MCEILVKGFLEEKKSWKTVELCVCVRVSVEWCSSLDAPRTCGAEDAPLEPRLGRLENVPQMLCCIQCMFWYIFFLFFSSNV